MHSLCWRISALFLLSLLPATDSFTLSSSISVQYPVLQVQYNIMTTQIRDTQFGHLVRYLSGKKLLRYPDEVDLSLCKKSFPSRLQRQQRDDVDPSDKPNDADRAGAFESETQSDDVEKADKRQTAVDAEATFLVDWYGPDDPEVSTVF